MPSRLIVFDFDGVIVDSEPTHESALLAAARSLGMSFTHDQYVNHYLGFDDRDTWLAIAKDNSRSSPETETARLNALKKATVDHAIARGEPRPSPARSSSSVAAVLARPVALCSSARRHEITPIPDRLDLTALFQTIVTADDVAKAKPDPWGATASATKRWWPAKPRSFCPP